MSTQPGKGEPLDGFQRVGSASQLGSGDRMLATVGDQDLVIFKLADNRAVAIPMACPHNGGPICEGDVTGSVLSCPWHGYQFDLLSGACEEDESLALQRFEVRIVGDAVWVKTEPS